MEPRGVKVLIGVTTLDIYVWFAAMIPGRLVLLPCATREFTGGEGVDIVDDFMLECVCPTIGLLLSKYPVGPNELVGT